MMRQRLFLMLSQGGGGNPLKQFGGTGLGLTITKNIVEMMGGQISVESEIGQGSTFLVIFHSVTVVSDSTSKIKAEKSVDPETIQFEKKTLLIADDIKYNREVIKGFLEDYDFILLEAENGKEVIDMAMAYKPDLILLDMKMPVMDGYETATILEKDDLLKDIPVIAVTASAMKNDEETLLRLCDSYLKKPVNKKDILFEIMRFLPYTIKGTSKDISEIFPLSTLNELGQLPDLIDILKNEQARCRQLSQLMAINKIEDFANEMKELGVRFNYQPLITFGTDLYNSTRTFDTEQIQQHLMKFQDFI